MLPAKACNKAFLAFALISLVVFSGCTGGPGEDISKLARGIPDVNAFLAEHPNANISAVLWSEEMTASNIDMLREKCGKRMEIQEYWYVIVEIAVPPKKIEIWINPPTKATVCIKKTGIELEPEDECSTDADCDDGKESTLDVCQGTPKRCVHHKITECVSGDYYCPEGCSYDDDDDCEEEEEDECDDYEECNDGDACTADSCVDEKCVHATITSCSSGDGCCPSGCSYANDSDCPLVDECSTNTDCIDGDNCTYDVCSGAPKVCSHPAITECVAGDGCCAAECDVNTDTDCITECVSGDGYCPSGCTYETDSDCPIAHLCDTNADCVDGDACTVDICSGMPRECSHVEITTCSSGDNCCPSGCTPLTDDDCEGCVSDENCSDGELCTEDSCADFVCRYAALPDGTECDVNSECLSGVCTEIDLCEGVDCDDGNPCTQDYCSYGLCGHTQLADGTSCGTGKECMGGLCNMLPVANAGADWGVNEDESVALDANESYDPDGTIVAYEWKDGATVLSTDIGFTKSNFSAGTHTVTLTVTDDDGATDSDTVVVTVSVLTGDLCDGQSGWVLSAQLEGLEHVNSLLQTLDGTIYAGTSWNGYIFKTTDGGTTWENIGAIPETVAAYDLIQASDGALYAATSSAGTELSKVFKSTDGAQTWAATGNLDITVPYTVGGYVNALIQASDGALYAGTNFAAEIFKSTDMGATWINKGPLEGEGAYSLFEASDGTLYAGTGTGAVKVFKSTDNGDTWVSTGSPGGLPVRALIQASDGSILAGGQDAFRYDGSSWINMGVGEKVYSFTKTSGGTIYAGTRNSVYKSTDDGETWVDTGLNLGIIPGAWSVLAASDGSIYAGTSHTGKIYKYCP